MDFLFSVMLLIVVGIQVTFSCQLDSANDVNLTNKALPVLLTSEQEVLYSSNHVVIEAGLQNGVREATIIENVDRGCGLTNRLKIIGGSNTTPNEFPWMAYLLITKYNATYMCGGFLVSNRHVITAAHCTTEISHDGIRVVLGDHDRTISTDSSSLMVRSERIDIHPLFNKPRRSNNDISVVTLANQVPFNSRISPVCLPEADLALSARNYTSRMATIMGWGKIGIGIDDPVSDELQQVQVSIMDHDECRDIYAEISVPITAQMMCAGSPQGGKDSCQGDSGGPLVVKVNGHYVVVGVASFGFSCASPTFPGVYTKVDRMLNFIEASTRS